jgi:hypothetical protein
VCSRNLWNEEALAYWGLLIQNKKIAYRELHSPSATFRTRNNEWPCPAYTLGDDYVIEIIITFKRRVQY